MTKDVIDAIRERTSMRAYETKEVPDETISRIIECGIRAPSAGNCQPWRFFVVKDPRVKAALAAAAYGQHFLEEASHVIVVCAEPERSAQRYGDRGRYLYCIQDTAAAVENMLLAATAFGLGTCWVGAFDEEAAARAIGVTPPKLRPVAMIPIGYPARPPKPSSRRRVEEVTTVI
ncbi:MAG TPA: nitroreductase family protein [Clostridia bacterium]|nr:nitroreductase family protein [Clostridia bacterium]